MPMTVEEYHQRWQSASINNCPWYGEKITRTSCIFFEGAVHSFMGGGEGYTILPDFGDAICWYSLLSAPSDPLLSNTAVNIDDEVAEG